MLHALSWMFSNWSFFFVGAGGMPNLGGGGLPNLAGLDVGALLSNPAVMNMVSHLIFRAE